VELKGGVARPSLFSLPEEFKSDFGDLWGVWNRKVGEGIRGERGEGGERAETEERGREVWAEDGVGDTEIEEDISEDEVEERSDDECDLWLDSSVAIPLEKVGMPTHTYSAAATTSRTWDGVLTREAA